MAEVQQQSDLVLPFGTHAMSLDNTKGDVQVHVGPMTKTLSQQEVPVIFDANKRFAPVQKEAAIKNNIVARKGEYVILQNPSTRPDWPRPGQSQKSEADTLKMGETINIPGPISFAPWPMQQAQVVEGHHLKSNEFLLVRVYDEEAARRNWMQSTIKLVPVQNAGGTGGGGGGNDPAQKQAEQGPEQPVAVQTSAKFLGIDSTTLVIGQLLLIKGTEASFYIPPTGVEVVKDDNKYVREALTLERLEYCLLVDEDGNKRYVRGPEVVFPLPTETFKVNDDNNRKSRAYELNEISGLHVKVIADYSDEIPSDDPRLEILKDRIVDEGQGQNLKHLAQYREGQELFITGAEQALYFPRVEHAILKYEGRTRYHAVAIPPGEARYVMNRITGAQRLERGPAMFLPDPRSEVIVKRILTPTECGRYYPGNQEVLAYNQALRQKNLDPDIAALMLSNVSGAAKTGHVEANMLRGAAYAITSSRSSDVIDRGSTYTPPRTLVIDSKFEGAVQISPYTGFAVQVVNKAGDRRVVVGPQTILLTFDERLETLLLSTGKPKSADKPIDTVYLRVANNSVSDIIDVRTKDLVPFRIQLKYLVRFLDEHKDRWFNIDNYVQHLVDHFRSMLSNYAKGFGAKEFHANGSNLLRDRVLGPRSDAVGAGKSDRPLRTFEENGMQVYDLDVIGLEIMDPTIRDSMQKLQNDQLSFQIQAERLEAELILTKRKADVTLETETTKLESESATAILREKLAQETTEAKHETVKLTAGLRVIEIGLDKQRAMLTAGNDFEIAETRAKNEEIVATVRNRVVTLTTEAQRIAWQLSSEEANTLATREIERMVAESKADVDRIQAISPQLTQALASLASTGSLALVAKHLGNLAIVKGLSLGGVVEQVFGGTQFEGLMKNLDKLGTGSLIEQGKS